jgi:dinuclear metal center YbgI/SA1388 family protein
MPIPLSGVFGKRISYLNKNDLSLLAYHLPLDCHPVIGNNAQLLSLLGARMTAPFGHCELGHWGWYGEYAKPVAIEVVQQSIKKLFGTYGTVHLFGPKNVRTIAAITGGGASYIDEAIRDQVDLFMTGELKEPIQELAREAGINVIAPGHYNTETLGVKALLKVVEKEFSVEAVFLDVPNFQ